MEEGPLVYGIEIVFSKEEWIRFSDISTRQEVVERLAAKLHGKSVWLESLPDIVEDRFTGFPLDWVSPAASFVVISSDEGLLGFHAADSAQNRKGEHNEMSILRLYRKQGN